MAVAKLNNNSIKSFLSQEYLQRIDDNSNKTGGESTTHADTNEPLSPITEEMAENPFNI
jgi:hypothetical protein